MKSRRRHTFGFVALLALLLSSAPAPSGLSPTPAAAGSGLSPQAAVRPEVRLRKLHLVRPDLIPYPIASEIYC